MSSCTGVLSKCTRAVPGCAAHPRSGHAEFTLKASPLCLTRPLRPFEKSYAPAPPHHQQQHTAVQHIITTAAAAIIIIIINLLALLAATHVNIQTAATTCCLCHAAVLGVQPIRATRIIRHLPSTTSSWGLCSSLRKSTLNTRPIAPRPCRPPPS